MKLKAKLKSNTVRKILAERNLPQKWLTLQLATSTGYMSQLMNGTRYPSPELRKRIMRVLGVGNFNELFAIKK